MAQAWHTHSEQGLASPDSLDLGRNSSDKCENESWGFGPKQGLSIDGKAGGLWLSEKHDLT